MLIWLSSPTHARVSYKYKNATHGGHSLCQTCPDIRWGPEQRQLPKGQVPEFCVAEAAMRATFFTGGFGARRARGLKGHLSYLGLLRSEGAGPANSRRLADRFAGAVAVQDEDEEAGANG